jgi:heme/copper-type cytochrome/quinol oxidase subunit 2
MPSYNRDRLLLEVHVMAANKTLLHTSGSTRHEQSNCLLLSLLSLASAIGLPVGFMLLRIIVSFVSPNAQSDAAFNPFSNVVFYIWLCATPVISIIALLAGRFESKRGTTNEIHTDVGILLGILSLVVWIMPAIGLVLGRI